MTQEGEAGSSPVTSVFGVAIFLGFLLLASQVLLHLYATSMITAVAFDAARRAAADGGSCPVEQTRARTALGTWAADPTTVTVTCNPGDGEFTTVTIRGPSPARGLRLYAQLTGMETIERSASVRTEAFGP